MNSINALFQTLEKLVYYPSKYDLDPEKAVVMIDKDYAALNDSQNHLIEPGHQFTNPISANVMEEIFQSFPAKQKEQSLFDIVYDAQAKAEAITRVCTQVLENKENQNISVEQLFHLKTLVIFYDLLLSYKDQLGLATESQGKYLVELIKAIDKIRVPSYQPLTDLEPVVIVAPFEKPSIKASISTAAIPTPASKNEYDFTYSERVITQFNEDRENGVSSHSVPLVVDPYAFTYGIETKRQNQTYQGYIDRHWTVPVEIIQNGKSQRYKMTIAVSGKDNMVYHRCLEKKTTQQFLTEFFQEGDNLADFPPLSMEAQKQKPSRPKIRGNTVVTQTNFYTKEIMVRISGSFVSSITKLLKLCTIRELPKTLVFIVKSFLVHTSFGQKSLIGMNYYCMIKKK